MRQDELYHYGVKGMKWKNHKYQKLENGRYVYRTPAEQRVYQARKDYNREDEQYRNYKGMAEIQSDPRNKEHFMDVANDHAFMAAYYKKKHEEALKKYKKSPMRNMKIAVRVGKARATNAIRHINERQDARKNKRQTNRKNRQFLRNRQYKKA